MPSFNVVMDAAMDAARPNLQEIAGPSHTGSSNVPAASSGLHTCPTCSKTFGQKCHLNRHMKIHQRATLLAPVAAIAGPSSSKQTSSAGHVCPLCSKTFTEKYTLTRHLKIHTGKKDYVCRICSKPFIRSSHLERHMLIHKSDQPTHDCPDCGKSFGRKDHLQQHLLTHLRAPQVGGARPAAPAPRRRRQIEVKTSDVFSSLYFYPSEETVGDLLLFIGEARPHVDAALKEELEEKRAIKWYLVSKIQFSRKTPEGEEEYTTAYFRSNVQLELEESTLSEHLDRAFTKIKTSCDEYTERGSDWVLDKIFHLMLKAATYHPLAPARYIQLPQKLSSKKAVLNIQNEDNKCFLWSVLAALHPLSYTDHPYRVSHYLPFEAEIKMGNVTFPVPPNKVKVIENLNNLRINIFGYDEDNVVYPLQISNREDPQCINLLYITDGERQHYCLIKDMSRLLTNLTRHKTSAFYCYGCLHRFAKEETLQNHFPYCNEHSPQRIKMPDPKDAVLKFSQYKFTLKVPYVIYADFEALVEKIDTTAPSSTVKTATHTPCGYAFVIIGPDGRPVKDIEVYRGPDVVDTFIRRVIEEKDELAVKLTTIIPMKLTAADKDTIKKATHCALCKGWLGQDRVNDHDHMTGQFRQVLHNECNLAFRLRKMIPCVFHNLKNYDAHMIMQGLGKVADHEIGVIPTTMEKYISFSITKKFNDIPVTLQFIDSLQFLNASLQKLVDNLEKDKFTILKEAIPLNYDLLLTKGIYPYEYMDCNSKFMETSLPPKSAFFSTLTGSGISDDDYHHAQNVWDTFQITNLGAYHDLYVKTDVLLLADVFENFRRLTLEYYQLDAAHMMTSPGLAWQAALKIADVGLDLFTDIDMHLFIEKGIRGGVSVISHRHSQANHQECPDYNSMEDDRHIIYLDANNLYGWAMSQYLPVGNFEWVDPNTISMETILKQEDDADEGSILEVDLDYPATLHDLHNDYPLAPERLNITPQMLSPTARAILEQMNMKPASTNEKLVPNLQPKNYVLHYRNLKLYLSLGLELVRIHRILKFYQQPWLKEYIELNTEKRKMAKTAFEKDFFKLMNNAVFGKTMENLRNRIDVQLVNTPKKAKKLVASPAFHAFTQFNDNLAAVQRKVKSLTLNRPIYAGFSILELSKIHMYDFHYNVILKKYGSKARLLFTDTDSLTYELTTQHLTRDLKEMEQFFDFSDYPVDHPLYSIINKKKLGFFKDELNGKSAYEFVGLRSKMYSILSEDGSKQTAKGISRSAAKQQLKHETYRNCLLQRHTSSVQQHRIGSEKHVIFSIQQTKRALSAFDDKRYLLEDGVASYAYGHYKIP